MWKWAGLCGQRRGVILRYWSSLFCSMPAVSNFCSWLLLSLPGSRLSSLISQKSFPSLSRALFNHLFPRKTSDMIEPFWCAASVLLCVRRPRGLFSACSLSLELSLTPKPLQVSLSSAEPSAQAPHLVCFCVELSLNPSGSLPMFGEAGA